MKTLLKSLAAFLLLFNGAGAIYGGGNLILHPDGSSIQLSVVWLEHTPFHTYLIPGIILFVVNGLFSIAALAALLVNHKDYPWLVIGQGVILLGWLAMQVVMIQTVYFLHFIMGGVGLSLLTTGWLLIDLTHPSITGHPKSDELFAD
jgi:hypothetical protein